MKKVSIELSDEIKKFLDESRLEPVIFGIPRSGELILHRKSLKCVEVVGGITTPRLILKPKERTYNYHGNVYKGFSLFDPHCKTLAIVNLFGNVETWSIDIDADANLGELYSLGELYRFYNVQLGLNLTYEEFLDQVFIYRNG